MKMDLVRALGAPRCVHVRRRGVLEGGPDALRWYIYIKINLHMLI
jgi:hypothetical protein